MVDRCDEIKKFRDGVYGCCRNKPVHKKRCTEHISIKDLAEIWDKYTSSTGQKRKVLYKKACKITKEVLQGRV